MTKPLRGFCLLSCSYDLVASRLSRRCRPFSADPKRFTRLPLWLEPMLTHTTTSIQLVPPSKTPQVPLSGHSSRSSRSLANPRLVSPMATPKAAHSAVVRFRLRVVALASALRLLSQLPHSAPEPRLVGPGLASATLQLSRHRRLVAGAHHLAVLVVRLLSHRPRLVTHRPCLVGLGLASATLQLSRHRRLVAGAHHLAVSVVQLLSLHLCLVARQPLPGPGLVLLRSRHLRLGAVGCRSAVASAPVARLLSQHHHLAPECRLVEVAVRNWTARPLRRQPRQLWAHLPIVTVQTRPPRWIRLSTNPLVKPLRPRMRPIHKLKCHRRRIQQPRPQLQLQLQLQL